MADNKRRPPSVPRCMDCRETTLHPKDGHFYCLKCLGASHDPFNCDFCDEFPQALRDTRLALVNEGLASGKWATDWLERLRKVEATTLKQRRAPRKAKKVVQSSEEDTEKNADTNQNTNTNQNQSQIDKSPMGNKSDTVTTEGVDNSEQMSEVHGNQNQNDLNLNLNITNPSPSLPCPTTPGFNPVELASWQAGINDMMGKMSQSLQGVLEKFEALNKQSQPQSPKKHKKKTSKKSKRDSKKSTPPPKKKRRVEETAPNPNTNLDRDIDDLSLTLPSDLDMSEYGDMPPPPNIPIPRIPNTDTSTQLSSDSDEDMDIDISRQDKRKLYLQSLKTLVPTLKHDTQREASGSGHFSLIKKPTTVVPKMPFLDEVFNQVSDTASPSGTFNNQRSYLLKKVKKYYPTTEPAESGLLNVRKVPSEIINQVPPYKVSHRNMQDPVLNTKFVEGATENAALQSFKYSSSAMRIANNLEIGVEAQGSLINRCFTAIEKITDTPTDLSPFVLNQLGSLQNSLRLMKQTMFDIKSSNNDLLQLALGQYNDSMLQRRNAWLSATTLPASVVNQLKSSSMAKPDPSNESGQLPMFEQRHLDSIKTHSDSQKDSAIIKLCTQRSQVRGRGQGRSRPSSRGGSSRGYIPHNQQQQSSYNQPRGRGRGRPFRGRGNSQQPFSRGKGKQTSV